MSLLNELKVCFIIYNYKNVAQFFFYKDFKILYSTLLKVNYDFLVNFRVVLFSIV